MNVYNGGQCITDYGDPQNVGLVSAMSTWHVNAVRIPLNEDCWLGINGVDPTTTAPAYQRSLHNFVSQLHQYGMYAILDLHESAPGTTPANSSQAMPDADHSPAFWASIASSFVNDKAVVFDLFNEPEFVNNTISAGVDKWGCWLSGCTINLLASGGQTSNSSWQAAGMQTLVNAVRGVGATQPIMLEGTLYGNDLTGWLSHVPSDSAHQLVASPHVYTDDVGGCIDVTCWNQEYAPIAARFPVVTGEFGEDDCAHGFMDQYMQFADANGISYLAWEWSWSATGSSCTPSTRNFNLIANVGGTPTAMGAGLQSHLAAPAG